MSAAPEAKTSTDFFEATRQGVADTDLRRKLENSTGRHLEHVGNARAEFPAYDAERDVARRIKEETLAHLDELLIELKRKLETNGCKVFVARDAAEARDYIVRVARAIGARNVVKGKSMTTEEIELNPALQAAGMEVVETDLGEYIVQLRHERPSHIITPAIHLSKEDIGQLFTDQLDIPYTAEPAALTAAARERLRRIFLGAQMGVTGVNFAIAETGTLVLIENEGNGRLCSTLPDTCVAVMGIEKVIPRLADLSHFLEILARTGTGQKLTTYCNFISGPRRHGELDGPRNIHVVIMDNGRSAMLADPVLREALCCLRCGACLNVCPVYRRIGGHAYNSVYPGPIGSIVSPNLFGSAAGHLPFASTLCGACRDICPVKIDIPRILLHLRWQEGLAGSILKWPRRQRRARNGLARFARMARYPRTMRLFGRLGGLLLRPFSRDGYLRWMPPPFNQWTRGRDFPAPRGRPFSAAARSAASASGGLNSSISNGSNASASDNSPNGRGPASAAKA
ncbi:MAG TPA: LutB/LldF family L-lactate oxidation iron-sulfur protein [Candidatus Binataceae bacterium]|nr:LutB/LldF family L-lactate oxidation iron-sulfur protein [Candidatus Binataceae bacterium]